MKKFWLVCRYEYLRHVRRKRFIFALLSMPAMILLMFAAGFLSVWVQYDKTPIGFVDPTHVLQNPQPTPKQSGELLPDPEIRKFPDENSARQSLDSKEIQGYFVLESSYKEDGSTRYVINGQMKDAAESAIKNFMYFNLISGQPKETVDRLMKGPTIEIHTLEGDRRTGADTFLSILLPLIVGVLFLLVINTSGSYLVGALVEEKENRTMEIMVTSVSTNQLMAGKVIGNLAVGLTELIVWVTLGVIALGFARTNLPDVRELNLDTGFLWLSFFTLLPAFVMVAGLMATAGVTTTDTREAQQIAGLFILPVVIPFWLIQPLMESPNSPLAVGLSLFPLTAPISLPLRAAFTNVPAWQIVLSLSILVGGAVFALWLAARAFRLGMLRYGKKLAWREIFGRA